MRTIKIIINAFIAIAVLPVTIVATLGFVFAPLQPIAHASEQCIVFQVNDLAFEAADAGR